MTLRVFGSEGGFFIILSVASLCFAVGEVRAEASPQEAVDATTLVHKVLCGYQGWFRCPGDAVNQGWVHWGRNRSRLTPDNLTVEMWPDLTGFDADEKYPAPGFSYPDGTSAALFSSVNAKTVNRHFEWMRQYGIDGVFLQRFLVELRSSATDRVLENVRAAAGATGRTYAICYDLSGASKDRIYETLVADWKRLVDEKKVTADERYLHHAGKPVLFVWGFYSDRFEAALAHRIIDFFKDDPKYGVTLIGGCEWPWRREKDPEWARAFRRFDVISPWNVGNVMRVEGQKEANTQPWKDDMAEARRAGMKYLPVIYPGFAWTHLKGPQSAGSSIPRLGGEFFWRQFQTAGELGIDMAYVAMFDEVDEGTAIYKCTNDVPVGDSTFATYEGRSSDYYLRLVGAASRLVRGDLEVTDDLPVLDVREN